MSEEGFAPTDLDTILGGEEAPEMVEQPETGDVQQPDAAEAVDVEAVSEEGEETGQEASTGDQEEDDGTPPSDEPEQTVPLNALLEERQKRQEMERQLSELRKAEENAADPEPDRYEDPDAHDAWQTRQNERLQVQASQAQLEGVHRTSELIARKIHGDGAVDAAMTEFEVLAKDNPVLAQQAINDPDPFGFIMDAIKRERALKEIGDPDTFKQRVRDEVLAELRKEQGQSEQARAAEQIPPSIVKEGSGRSVTSEGSFTPTPLAEIIKN